MKRQSQGAVVHRSDIIHMNDDIRIVQCVCLGKLLHYFDPSSEMSLTDAYQYALGVILGSGLFVFVDHPYTFECYRTGMQIRTACSSLVYRKVSCKRAFESAF